MELSQLVPVKPLCFAHALQNLAGTAPFSLTRKEDGVAVLEIVNPAAFSKQQCTAPKLGQNDRGIPHE
jgi:hypothetical protein